MVDTIAWMDFVDSARKCVAHGTLRLLIPRRFFYVPLYLWLDTADSTDTRTPKELTINPEFSVVVSFACYDQISIWLEQADIPTAQPLVLLRYWAYSAALERIQFDFDLPNGVSDETIKNLSHQAIFDRCFCYISSACISNRIAEISDLNIDSNSILKFVATVIWLVYLQGGIATFSKRNWPNNST